MDRKTRRTSKPRRESGRWPGGSGLWWIGLLGVATVVGVTIALVSLLQPDPTEPTTVESSVSGLSPSHGEDPPPEEVSTPRPGHAVGDIAPGFSLPALDGSMVALSDYRGQIVLLDFWASWCAPCRVSMPSLVEMARAFGEDVVLIGISLDRSEGDARSYVSSRGYEELVALYGSLGEARAVAGTYGVLGIPKTFVIDREGIVRFADHPSLLTQSLVESLL